MKTAIKLLLFLCAGAYLVFALVKFAHRTEDVTCSGVSIILSDTLSQGFISERDVEDILAKNKIFAQGESIDKLDLGLIETRLKESPYIERAKCYFSGNGNLCIKVFPQHPILRIMSHENGNYYLDREGLTMPAGDINMNLCVATGSISKDFASKKLLPLAQFIHDDPFWKEQIVQINVTPKGEIELFPRVGEHKILLGGMEDYEKKLHKMRIFYKNGLPRVGWNRYKIINLAFDGQIVCIRNNK